MNGNSIWIISSPGLFRFLYVVCKNIIIMKNFVTYWLITNLFIYAMDYKIRPVCLQPMPWSNNPINNPALAINNSKSRLGRAIKQNGGAVNDGALSCTIESRFSLSKLTHKLFLRYWLAPVIYYSNRLKVPTGL